MEVKQGSYTEVEKGKTTADWFRPSILDQNNPWCLGGGVRERGDDPGWKKSSLQPSKQAEQAEVQSNTAVSLSFLHLVLLPAHKPLPAPSNE